MKTYKVGVVGLHHGANHARLLQLLDQAECTVVCDVQADALQSVSRELGIARTTAHYADLLADPDLDIISINTPCQIHGQMALAALEAGKHVMVEVPMENESMDRLWKIIWQAERRHLKVQMDCADRWIPESVYIKRLITEGKLGELYYVICEYIQDIRRGLLDKTGFRMGYGLRAQDPVSAGAGIYALDTARWFLGEQFSEVFAYGNRKNLPMRQVDDHDVALFRTASGAIARVQCSKAARRPGKEIIKSVWGTKGTVECAGYLPTPDDGAELYACLVEDGAGAIPYPGAYEMTPLDVPPIPLPAGVTREFADAVGHGGVEFFSWLDLLRSIEEDRMPTNNVYEAARTCAGAIAVKISKAEHRPVAIPAIADRHEELQLLYPLPYSDTTSDEL